MIARGSYTGRQVDTGDGEQSDVYGWAEHTARRTSRSETLLGPSASLREGLRDSVERRGFSIR